MKKTKQLDRIILFEIGMIIALLITLWFLNLKYENKVSVDFQMDSAYLDSPFIMGAIIEEPVKQEQKQEQQAVILPFMDNSIIKQVDDLFKLKDEPIKMKMPPTKGPIKLLPIGSNKSSKIDTFVNVMPQFPGGETALASFIQENYHITDRMYEHAQEVQLIVRFVVRKNGEVTDVKVVNCDVPYVGAEQEALKLFSRMPNWIPGHNGEDNLNVFLQIPIRISIY